MKVAPDLASWRSIGIEPEAWRRPDVDWDPANLIEVVVAVSTASSTSQLTSALVGIASPGTRLRSWEVVFVGLDGGLHRIVNESPDADLLAWAVSRMWTVDTAMDRLHGGGTHVELCESPDSVETLACVPLLNEGEVKGIISLWITTVDVDAAMQCVSRLTLISHLWSRADALSNAHSDVDTPMEVGIDSLSARQLLILQAMALGRTNGQIARQIGFSESTVRVESMSIYRIFHVHSRVDAVRLAREWGVL